MKLRKYQQEALDNIINNARKGFTKQIIVLATGGGKAQPLDTPVVVEEGYKRIGDIKEGDKVFCATGKPVEVIGIYPQGYKEVYKIHFSDGTETEACGDHLWEVSKDNIRWGISDPTIKTTKQLYESINTDKTKWLLPEVGPVQFSKKEQEIPAHLLAEILIGVRDFQEACTIAPNKEGFIMDLLERKRHAEFKTIHNYIPLNYIRGNVEQRLELLRTIMDICGHERPFENRGYFTTCRIQCSNLLLSFIELVRSLGGIINNNDIKSHEGCFHLEVNMAVNPFTPSYKADLWQKKHERKRRKSIRHIERLTSQQECVCIKVDSERELYLVQNFTPTHNTVIFSQLPPRVRDKGKKTLILAHREELLNQAKDKLLKVDPTLKVGIEQGVNNLSKEDIAELDVIIASVQTIGKTNSKRLKKFQPDDFGLIITDECHRATSATYTNIFEYFDVLKGKVKKKNGRVLLGVTATPNRTDHQGLDKVFDKISFTYTLKQGIEDGYLVNIKAYNVTTDTDLSEVHTRLGDFAEGELADAVNNPKRNKLVVESYLELARGTKALAFAANIKHTEALTQEFRDYGLRANCILGKTPKQERRDILQSFKEGKLDVLVNCGVLCEGFDEPSIETVLMARPTKSSVLFSQMVGRGTRLYEGKDHVNIIDFQDNLGNNSVMGVPSLFGVQKRLRTRGVPINKVTELAQQVLDLNPEYPVEEIEDWSEGNIKKIIEEIDIFKHAKLPEVIKTHSKLAWSKHQEGYKIQFLPEETTKEEIRIEPNMLNNYALIMKKYGKAVPSYSNGYNKWVTTDEEELGQFKTIEEAIKNGDKYIWTRS